LARWLLHGRPSLDRFAGISAEPAPAVAEVAPGAGTPGAPPYPRPTLSGRPVADDVELLALVNVMTQLDHLRGHPGVARRMAEGTLHLHGMYFHVAEAQAYILDGPTGVFTAVRPDAPPSDRARLEPPDRPDRPAGPEQPEQPEQSDQTDQSNQSVQPGRHAGPPPTTPVPTSPPTKV